MKENNLTRCLMAISCLATRFQQNPYNYLSERDIQCDLFSTLRSAVDQKVQVPKSQGGDYELNLIYAEYNKWIDICCLDFERIDQKQVCNYKPTGSHDDYVAHLPVLLAIELKFMRGRRKGNFRIFLSDEKKLVNIVQDHLVANWISICFIHVDEVALFHRDNIPEYEFTEIQEIVNLNKSYAVTDRAIYELNKA